MASDIICLIKDTEYAKARIDGLALGDNKISIQDLFNERTLSIENANFLQYQEVMRQILIGRMINADQLSVEEDKVFVVGGTYEKLHYSQHGHDRENISLHSVVVKADEWNGEYVEYDLVNRLWPIVSPNLFNQLQLEGLIKLITKRCKTIDPSGNALCSIAAIDPVLMHPYYGIGTKRKDRFEKVDCYVGEFENIQRNFWLYELSDFGKLTEEEKISPVLFVFIAPRELNGREEIRLTELETEIENAQYVKGVREGWSILFLGAIKKYIIEPGKISREQIVQKIPRSFKEIKPDIKYVFTDGSVVF